MPAIVDRYRVGKANDRRIRLSDEQRDEIKQLFIEGFSKHGLARMFGVSKRLIQFICNPASHAANLEARQRRGGTMIYYDKNLHKEYMAGHRGYKKKLIEEKLI